MRAGRRHGLVVTADLRACGFDRHAVGREVRAGRLHPRFAGVYSLGHLGLSGEGVMLAAALACGPAAAISHRTAGHIWGWIPTIPSKIEVTVANRAGRTDQPGLRIHRVRSLHRWENTTKDGIPVTTPVRTLVDLASIQPIERALHLALANRLVDANGLRAYLDDARRRPGAAALRAALADAHPEVHRTRSELERVALRLIGRARLLTPRVNAVRGPHELDLVWDAQRVVVELDGYGHHRSAAALNADLRRTNDLEAAGWKVRRFTWAHLRDDPDWVIDTIAAAIGSIR